MHDRTSEIVEMVPVLTRCSWGGWLAVSGPGSVLPIGVVADTEDEARSAFAEAARKWASIGQDE